MAGEGGNFDRTRRYHDGRDDEVGRLAKAFDGLVGSLARVVRDIRRNNSERASSVGQLAATGTTVAEAARLLDEVASTAEANRTAMDETIGMVRRLEGMAGSLSASVEHFHV